MKSEPDITKLAFIGQTIKVLRSKKGMKQWQLADICGFQQSTLSKIESGKANITLHVLHCIAMALEIEIAQLLTAGNDSPL